MLDFARELSIGLKHLAIDLVCAQVEHIDGGDTRELSPLHVDVEVFLAQQVGFPGAGLARAVIDSSGDSGCVRRVFDHSMRHQLLLTLMLLLNQQMRIVTLRVKSPISLTLQLLLEGLARGILPLCHFDELTDRLEVRLGDKVAVRVLV